MKALLIASFLVTTSLLHADPLPSWKTSPTKDAIVSFVEKVTTPGSPDYVVPAERIATFDNDGCLWCEQPMYFQVTFIFDRIKAIAPEHPEWETTEPFASVLKDDIKGALSGGEEALIALAMAAHGDVTAEDFQEAVSGWLATTRHPKTGLLYKEMVYQPMLELLTYLRAEGFKTFIVSGGGVDFIRAFAEDTYGIPPEQVVGTRNEAKYELRDGKPVIVKLPTLDLVDDKEGKPVGIHQHIGRRPIFAAGNSDGDFQMLEYTTSGEGPRFGLLIHHTDAEREFAYDRESHIGQLNRGLDEGPARGWTIVDMKEDWHRVFPETAVPE